MRMKKLIEIKLDNDDKYDDDWSRGRTAHQDKFSNEQVNEILERNGRDKINFPEKKDNDRSFQAKQGLKNILLNS